MDTWESLNHSVWDCKYHVVFIPKCRRKTLYGELRRYLGEVFRRLAQQKESRIEEGHLLSDHVHMLIAMPPKYAVAQVVGFIKGKSAIDFGAGVRGAQTELCGAANGLRQEATRRRLSPAIGRPSLRRWQSSPTSSVR